MSRPAIAILLVALSLSAPLSLSGAIPASAAIPSPREFLGHDVGEDRYLAPWDRVVAYMRALDEASDRISIESAGTSTLGNDMPVVILTSEENQRNLSRHRDTARRLALSEDLSEEEANTLIDQGKAIVLVTCSIHSTEVGSTQMAMELAHQIATTTDDDMLRWLDDVILLVMPSINPDGQVMVVDWYNKHLGTEHEGGRLPWLYHHYAGHDNNRDFYMLTQKESRAVNDVLYKRWFPQVFLDEHQMGSTGPRMFVPPQTDPVAPEISSMTLMFADLMGTMMALRLEEAGKRGVGRDMIFDSYWPGGTRNTAWWKNVVGLLTEVASARIATPLTIEPGELEGGQKGLPTHVRRANYLSPWEGGSWRLRDIIDYELIATKALLEGCSRYRRDLLANVNRLAREETSRGRTESPYAFLVPKDQHDLSATALMIDLLLRHGVHVDRADADIVVQGVGGASTIVPSGSFAIRTAQPYRPFILTMLTPQRYPEILDTVGGKNIPPYDVTSWSLPIAMGVDVLRVDAPFDPVAARLRRLEEPVWPGGKVPAAPGGYLIPHAADAAFLAMNRLIKQGRPVYWLQETGDAPPGDIWIPHDAATQKEMSDLSVAARVPIHALASRPRGRALRVERSRAGLYKPWDASMDEGWTRWLFDTYEVPYTSIDNKQITSGLFTRNIDVLVLPDVGKSIIAEGRPPEGTPYVPLPTEYAGGLGTDGAREIKKWVREKGGVVVALDSSADYIIDILELPVRNVLAGEDKDRVDCPGSMLRLLVDATHPVAYGMRAEDAGYFAGSPAFETRVPDPRFDRRVVASYPERAEDLLVSGYLRGGEMLARRAAVVDLKVGNGRVVLIGLRAQHRAQPHRTFKLLFNAVHLPGLEETSLP